MFFVEIKKIKKERSCDTGGHEYTTINRTFPSVHAGTHAFCSVLFLIIALTEQKKEKKEDEEYREEWAILFPQQKLKTRILVQERGESNLAKRIYLFA